MVIGAAPEMANKDLNLERDLKGKGIYIQLTIILMAWLDLWAGTVRLSDKIW